MSRAHLPEMEEGLLGRGSNAFFRDVLSAQLWTLNSFYALKRVFSEADTSLGESQREAEVARIRLEEAESSMRAAQAAEVEMAARAEEAQRRAEAAEKALDEARHQAKLEADAAEEKIKKLEAELSSHEMELHTVTIQVRGAEERAENAEEVARCSDARAAAMEEEARKAKEEAAEAKRSASNAVTMYQESPAYKLNLADAAAYSYDLGFKDCKLKIKEIFHIDGVEDIEPDILEDGDDDGTAPTES